MGAGHSPGILDEPLQPDVLRECPYCRKRFALKPLGKEASEIAGWIRTFRCKYCLRDVQFADRHPPGAI